MERDEEDDKDEEVSLWFRWAMYVTVLDIYQFLEWTNLKVSNLKTLNVSTKNTEGLDLAKAKGLAEFLRTMLDFGVLILVIGASWVPPHSRSFWPPVEDIWEEGGHSNKIATDRL